MKLTRIYVFLIALIILTDLYAFRGLIRLIESLESGLLRHQFPWIFWGISVLMLGGLVWAGSVFRKLRDPKLYYRVTLLMGFFLMIYFPKLVFNLFQILSDLFHLVSHLISEEAQTDTVRVGILYAGALLGMVFFFAFGIGMARGKDNVKVFRETIALPGLPGALESLKIVQLSDLHLAGFYNNTGHIQKIVRMVNHLEPDLIMFTGDLVNNFAEEADPFTGILNKLKAPVGKFAVLGNHDYGDYYNWGSETEKTENIDRVKQQIRAAGFDLLTDEHRTVSLNGITISIAGVENIGKPPIPRYGDLVKAKKGMKRSAVNILLSHDPFHWEEEIRDNEEFDLTLSGHTHGMQFGIEIGKLRWSLSRWQYRHWGGLYRENGKYLYVNRGLGYTGFPGRVGIRPEITLLTLKKEEAAIK
ncbi:MAG: metallophosphoesterase [Bacteroidales bacterium]|nr:metallophosphoesterase [Bacteroidales bacterium]